MATTRMATATLRILPLVAVFAFAATVAQGQPYPSKPVRIVLGFPPATTVDVLVRPLAQKLGESLGQQFVVENRPGATGLIANEAVARATPDGYVLLGAPGSSLTSSPQLHAKPPFDALKDFAPIAQIGAFGYVFIAHPGVPSTNVKQLVSLARAKPGFLTYGSSGIGSGFHLAGELFTSMAGVKMLHVPYKGGTAALNDMLAGRIDMTFDSFTVYEDHIRSGRVRALGVTSKGRVGALPDVPTIAEQGLAGYDVSNWLGVFAPAGTPADVVETIHEALGRTMETPALRKQLIGLGIEPVFDTPEAFADLLKQDLPRWKDIVGKSGAKAE